VSGSAVGYYGPRDDTPLDESAAPGDDFLARVCREWEAAAAGAEAHGIRVVRVRTGIVLAADGGALPMLALPYHLFVGGPVLPGTQWLSWIHLDDEVGLLVTALDDERARGPLNATAPEPLTNAHFGQVLGRVLERPSRIPVPGFALHLLLGEGAEMLTTGRRVVPARARDLGYAFQFPNATAALQAIYASPRAA
jgi:uncharacterized protein (TIGR01777 family)